jgi:hypothetical protein
MLGMHRDAKFDAVKMRNIYGRVMACRRIFALLTAGHFYMSHITYICQDGAITLKKRVAAGDLSAYFWLSLNSSAIFCTPWEGGGGGGEGEETDLRDRSLADQNEV